MSFECAAVLNDYLMPYQDINVSEKVGLRLRRNLF